MWFLVVISFIFGNPSGVSSVNFAKFPTQDACETAANKINEVTVVNDLITKRPTSQRAQAFCTPSGGY